MPYIAGVNDRPCDLPVRAQLREVDDRGGSLALAKVPVMQADAVNESNERKPSTKEGDRGVCQKEVRYLKLTIIA